ncbi:TetR/AcrR family transcriptional regulator [Rothia sp. AR01]|uniref:TetR/AcrR family transcriptional regulator n=1 Tax=Rothia santali TaxID=2949643 RepID=A0A9X2HCB1_9MICC|nr:TetR/AcrR family transcriptional regulator [Rothia santali]MCP3425082.1 TetR/AcrR family transcriptional regulator [Rothia santali]
MNRMTRHHREQLRRKILDSSRELFVTQGCYGATMDDVAVVSGLSKPALYRHFDSKDELCIVVVEECSEFVESLFSPALFTGLTLEERVSRMIALFIGLAVDHPHTYAIVFESDMGHIPDVADRLHELRDTLLQSLTVGADEDLAPEAAEEFALRAEMMLAAVIPLSKRIGVESVPLKRDNLQKVLFETMWGGLRSAA